LHFSPYFSTILVVNLKKVKNAECKKQFFISEIRNILLFQITPIIEIKKDPQNYLIPFPIQIIKKKPKFINKYCYSAFYMYCNSRATVKSTIENCAFFNSQTI